MGQKWDCDSKVIPIGLYEVVSSDGGGVNMVFPKGTDKGLANDWNFY